MENIPFRRMIFCLNGGGFGVMDGIRKTLTLLQEGHQLNDIA